MGKEQWEGITSADVWAMFAETDKRMKQAAEEARRTDERMKQMFAETDEQMKRRFAETDEQMKQVAEESKRVTEQVKRTEAAVDKLYRSATRRDDSMEELKKLVGVTSDNVNRHDDSMEELKKLVGVTSDNVNRHDDKLEELKKLIGGVSNNIGHHAEQFFQDALAKSLTFGGEKYDYMLPNLKYKGKKNDNGEFDIVLINGKSVALIEAKNRIHPDTVKKLANEQIAKFRQYFSRYNDCRVYLGIAGFSFCDEVLEEAKNYGIGIIKQVGDSVEIEAEHLKAY